MRQILFAPILQASKKNKKTIVVNQIIKLDQESCHWMSVNKDVLSGTWLLKPLLILLQQGDFPLKTSSGREEGEEFSLWWEAKNLQYISDTTYLITNSLFILLCMHIFHFEDWLVYPYLKFSSNTVPYTKYSLYLLFIIVTACNSKI